MARYNLGNIVSGVMPTDYMPDYSAVPYGAGAVDPGVLMSVASDGSLVPVSAVTTDGGTLPVMPGTPNFTSAQMPSMTTTANAAAPTTAQPPAITPQYLNQRLPSIVSNVPMDMTQNDCDPVSQWVNENPMLAIGALILGYALFVGRR